MTCHNLSWDKSKSRALFVLEPALQIEERALKRKWKSQFDTELALEVEEVNVTNPYFTFQAESKTGTKILVSRWKQHAMMIQRAYIC